MGSRLPQERCAAFGGVASCPRDAVTILKKWGNGEYWKPVATWPCLALPDVACPDPSARDKLSWHRARQEGDPRNIRLQAEGLSGNDVKILKSKHMFLRRHGYLAHNFSGC